MRDETPSVGTAHAGIDLLAAAAAFEKIPGRRAFSDCARRLSGAWSARADLEEALKKIGVANAYRPASNTPEHEAETGTVNAAIAGALFQSALILYARATKSDTSGRAKVPIARDYDGDQAKIHAAIVELRDKAVAHYGSGEGLQSGPWDQDELFMILGATEAQYRARWRRMQLGSAVFDDLSLLLHVALGIVGRLIEERSRKLDAEIHRLSENDVDFGPDMRRFLVRVDDVPHGTWIGPAR